MQDIFRLETSNFEGIYAGCKGFLLELEEPYHYDEPCHPTWHNDNLLKGIFCCSKPPTPHYHFGFDSIHQLKMWLTGVNLKLLKDSDIIFVHYQIQPNSQNENNLQYFVKGKKQCLFLKEHATMIKYYSDIEDLANSTNYGDRL